MKPRSRSLEVLVFVVGVGILGAEMEAAMLYTLAAIVVGHYASMRQRHDTLPRFTLSVSGWRWLPIALAVMAALYVLVAVLLRMS